MSYNPQYWAKEIMRKKINTQKLISGTYKELLRFMLSLFSDIKVIDPENQVVKIACLNASPERAVAKLYQENNLVLPVITLFQSTSQEDTKRRRPSDIVLPESYWDEEKQRAFRVVTLAPHAININYELNVWTKFNEDMDQIAEQIRLLFSPDIKVVTKYTNSTSSFLVNESNTSQLIAGDREDRVLRRKFEIVVEGYIPYPKFLVTSTGEMTEFNSEFEVISKTELDLDDYPFDASAINDTEIGSYSKK